MKEAEKKIKIDDNRTLIYRKISGYTLTYKIEEHFLKDGHIEKNYWLSQWDDYGFNAWINDDKAITKVSFEFDIDHPLFIPLFEMLNYDKELIIDDDDTSEFNKKYMRIHREEDKIYMDFIDNITDPLHATWMDKFNVFIKNISPDGRSKIDCQYKDTKERLWYFFNEVFEDYHQITIEEILLRNNKPVEEIEPIFKKVYKKKTINN